MTRRGSGRSISARWLISERLSGTVTFLFSDIEGSTRLLKAVGRDRYGDLLRRHQELLREAFAAHRGEEIDTQGDSFFAAFQTASDAVAAGVAIQRTLAAEQWPAEAAVRVRIGIHSGEASAADKRYVGFAVHRAARIGAAAHGGQILVSATTRELVEDDLPPSVSLRSLGAHRLKDLDRPERLWQVVSDSRPARFPALRTERQTRFGRRRFLLFTAGTAAIAAAAVAAIAMRGGSGSATALAGVDANNVGVIDATGAITAEDAIGSAPSGVAAGAGAVWVTADDGTVSRIDPSDAANVRQTIPVGTTPHGVVVYEGFVWVSNSSDGTVTKIDPQTNRTVGPPIVVGNAPSELAAGGGFLWVADALDGTVSRLDPQRDTVSRSYATGRYASGVAYGANSFWVSDESRDVVARIDPETGRVLAAVQLGSGSGPRELVFGIGALWVANSLGTTVARIDPASNSVTAAITVGEGPRAIAIDRRSVWVAVEFGNKVVQIDAATSSIVKTIQLGSRPEGIAVAEGRAFVAARASPSSHRGGTLTVLNQDYGSLSNSLVSFRRANGGESLQLIPDLATSLPTPTDGGRTYTFQLRRGIHYSNGQRVRPEDVRHSIEREFKLSQPNGVYFGPIVGGDACAARPKTCDLSRGIVADDRSYTVTFNLAHADPYFLYESPEPLVPASTPDREVSPTALPVTGPYMVERFTPDRETTLIRNPHFNVWSEAAQADGFADRIVEKFGVSPAAALRMVERGAADLAEVPSESRRDIGSRYPNRLHIGQIVATSYLQFDTHVPPFNDVRVRRALNFAIDRAQLLDPGGQATCQVLPPNFPAHRPYCPYTVVPSARGDWVAPDLVQARRLVAASHTRGTRVTLVWPAPDRRTQAQGRYVASILNRLGYRARLKLVPPARYGAALAGHPQVFLNGFFADYPAAADFIKAFTCDSPYALFCARTIDVQIKRALALDRTEPGAANQLWERIDRMIVDEAAIVPLETPAWAFLVSKRIGNLQVQNGNIAYNPLLDQLWVR